jgi:hypothetical protein
MENRKLKPWEGESDFVDNFRENYHIVVSRHPEMGNLNGYVGVRRNHPLYGRGMDDKKISRFWVHGGVTFAGKVTCLKGFKKNYWYIGFDTAHYGDLIPSLDDITAKAGIPSQSTIGKRYKDIRFVSTETNKLLEQIMYVERANPNFKPNYFKEYKRLHKEKVRAREMSNYINKL